MKKITQGIMAAFLLLSLIPVQLKAETDSKTATTIVTKPAESTTASTQLARLEEIKAMDLSTLSRSEKKELRQEVRAIKNDQDGYGRRHHDGDGRNYEGRHGGGEVFFIGGGGLLVILLIILLL